MDTWIHTPFLRHINLESLSVHLVDRETLLSLANLGSIPSLRNLFVFVNPVVYDDDDVPSHRMGTFRVQHASMRSLILENCLLEDMLSDTMADLTKLSLSFDESVVH